MADKPQKCVVIIGDGCLLDSEKRDDQESAITTLEDAGLQHLHAVAKDGCSGFLALRGLDGVGDEVGRSLSELAQLLDVYELYTPAMMKEDSSGLVAAPPVSLPSLSARFKGLPAAMLTNSAPAAALGARVGITSLPFISTGGTLPKAPAIAAQVLNLLNLNHSSPDKPARPADVVPTGTSTFDLVIVHIHAHTLAPSPGWSAAVSGLQWIDGLLGCLRALSPPGSAAARHLYTAPLLSYPLNALQKLPPPLTDLRLTRSPATGAVRSNDNNTGLPGWDALRANTALQPGVLRLRPKQSYRFKGGEEVPAVRDHHPLLAVYHLEAVTRRDACERAGVEECRKHGANLAILADRFLHELAFKMWRAPKYGA